MTPEENQLLEQIKRSRASVRAVGDYVRLVKDGSEWRALCPFHADKNPSLKIFVHEGVYLYKCFGCGASGNLVQFVENITSCSFKEALETVKQKLGSGQWDDVKKKSSNFAPIAPPEKKRTFTLAQHAKYEVALADSLAGLEFLRARGIEHSTAQRLHLGYVQDISKFCPKYAAMKKEIAAQGWISIPYIKNDTVILVQYRSIVARERCRFPGMSTTIFNGDTVEGISPVFVCEGAFDSLVLEQAGFRSVAMYNASQGLSPEDKDIIMNADSVILAVDTDEAGMACAAKLQAELGEKTLTIRWPEKDANDTLLKTCGGDKAKFKELVDGLVSAAKETPMPSVHSLQEAMLHSGRTDLTNHPDRLKFPWPAVDKMAILLPGSVTYVSATDTKMGKTVWTTQSTLYQAMIWKERVISWQCELTVPEFTEIAAAHILHKSRNHLTKEDYAEASKRLAGTVYYVGHNPMMTEIEPVLDLLEAAIRRLSPTVVVLDHLHHLCENAKDTIKAQGAAMVRIKSLAGTYGVKFIVVGQPRKADQNTKGKSRHVSDIRGAAAIGQSTDAMFSLHREYIKSREEDNPADDVFEPKTEVHLQGVRAKGDGKASAFLLYLGDCATFVPISLDKPPEDKLF